MVLRIPFFLVCPYKRNYMNVLETFKYNFRRVLYSFYCKKNGPSWYKRGLVEDAKYFKTEAEWCNLCV